MKTSTLASIAGAVATALGTSSLSSSAVAAPMYNIYQIAPLGADTSGSGNGVSTNGAWATGFSQHTAAPAGSNPVLWNVAAQTGSLQPALASPVRAFNEGNAVNNSGVIVGRGTTTTFGSSPVPIIVQGGVTSQLPFPSASWNAGRAQAINNNNVAVGSAQGGVGFPETATIFTTGGSTAMTELTTAGGRLVTAFGINDAGRIVGQATDPNLATTNVMFYIDTGDATATPLPNLAGKNGGTAFAVSSDGRVAGSNTFNGGSGVPFIWDETNGIQEVPMPGGATSGGARGVNSSGWVVGTASTAFALPFLYDGVSSVTLQSLITDPTWNLSTNTSSGAFGISDTGVIVGRGVHNGVISGFVMVPVPEPTTVTLAALGAGAIAIRRRRGR